MSYLHISNLHSDLSILLFRECFAMEKIHGSSAHVAWRYGEVRFFSGGVNHQDFLSLFDDEKLAGVFRELGHEDVTVYGEAYGGKCQGMSKTYGKQLRFAAFDVRIGQCWLNVPAAHDVVSKLGLEFVPYTRIPATIEALDAERDRPSEQAKRNGIAEDMLREGIVVRPLFEYIRNNGDRVIAKHKRPEFSERKTPVPIDPAQRQIIEDANAIAEEFVTAMRLRHILDKLPEATAIEHTGDVVKAMIEDVCREAAAEILDSKPTRTAIGRKAAALYKKHVSLIPVDGCS